MLMNIFSVAPSSVRARHDRLNLHCIMYPHLPTNVCFTFIPLLLIIGVVLAAPVRNLDPELIFYENNANEKGYSFSYKTKDGQYRDESGSIDAETGVLVVTGVYGFVGTDGKTYEFNYEADQNGYRIVKKQPEVAYAPISQTALLSLVG